MTWRQVLLQRRGATQPPQASAGEDVEEVTAVAPPPSRACEAPFSSIYLDQAGCVRACCMNDLHLLGNIAAAPLSQIWHGRAARELRRAMERHDLTLGCEICKWQVDEGRPDLAYSRWYSDMATVEPEPDWPRQIEFSISNTCNLQCAMCNGEWSSSIRAQREGREPLPKVYGEAFFEDLADFLPHLDRVKFLGGEPFLAPETLRIMEMLVERGLSPRCHVTTNGTQWSPRVERILNLLPVDVSVSLDAATQETYESIRVGSSWDLVQANLDRFQDWSRRRGTHLSVTFCLMTSNWHEFADFCRQADARGIASTVNMVSQPAQLSLLHLDAAPLQEVVAGLDEMGGSLADGETLGAQTWLGELAKLRQHLEARKSGREVVGIDSRNSDLHRMSEVAFGSPEIRAAMTAELEAIRARLLPPMSSRLHFDRGGVIDEVRSDADVVGFAPAEVSGLTITEMTALFKQRHGAALDTRIDIDIPAAIVQDVLYSGSRRLVVITAPSFDDMGARDGTWFDVGWACPG